MTITVNTIGPNSRQIVIEQEVGQMNIINAVSQALVDLGQTLHDSLTSGKRNCLVTKVFVADNNDEIDIGEGPKKTQKYMILRFDGPQQYWNVSCCEYQDNVSHTPTNECFTNGRSVILPLQYDYCTLYVFASERYAFFFGTVLTYPSSQQGVFEFERIMPEDKTSVGTETANCCFGWTSSINIGQPWAGSGGPNTNYTTNSHTCNVFCVPRTLDDQTGVRAKSVFTITTSYGSYPPNSSNINATGSTTSGITYSLNNQWGMLGGFGSAHSYVFDYNKSFASSLKLQGQGYFLPYGRIYGLTVTDKIGDVLDTVNLPVDSNGFFDTDATNALHAVFQINGGYTDSYGPGTNRLSLTQITSGAGTQVYDIRIINGRFLFLSTSGGFKKYDILGDAWVDIVSFSCTGEIAFDGTETVYLLRNNIAINKYNINTDEQTEISGFASMSRFALKIDDNNLYSCNSATSINPQIQIMDLDTEEETIWTSSVSYTASRNFTNIDIIDYKRYILLHSLKSTVSLNSTSDLKITKLNLDTMTGSNLTLNTSYVSYTTSNGFGFTNSFYDGNYYQVITNKLPAGLEMKIQCLDPESFTLNTFGISSSSSFSSVPNIIQQRTLNNNVIPFNGYQLMYGYTTASTVFLFHALATGTSSYTIIDPVAPVNTSITFGSAGDVQRASICYNGCFAFYSSSGSNITKVSNMNGTYNAAGKATANILVKL